VAQVEAMEASVVGFNPLQGSEKENVAAIRSELLEGSLRAGAVGFWDPAAKTRRFCEEIANGRLAMMTVIGMFSSCRRGWLLEPGCEDQQALRGDRERTPGHDGNHRHVLCIQARLTSGTRRQRPRSFAKRSRRAAWP
jgi:hypothetical protein